VQNEFEEENSDNAVQRTKIKPQITKDIPVIRVNCHRFDSVEKMAKKIKNEYIIIGCR